MSTAARGRFWLTVVSFNLGRKYRPGQFTRSLLRVMEHVDGREHVVLLPQELDEEPDPANEHARLARELVPGTRRVYWRTREPILLSPGFDVVTRRRVKIMGSGREIDAARNYVGTPLRGVGPARHLSMCVARERRTGIRLGFGNFHPHRSGLDPRVDEARDQGAGIVSTSLNRLRRPDDHEGGVSGAYGTDYNSRRMPRMVAGERVAVADGLDHLRYWQHPTGARLELLNAGTLEGEIDPHDFPYARFLVTAPRKARP